VDRDTSQGEGHGERNLVSRTQARHPTGQIVQIYVPAVMQLALLAGVPGGQKNIEFFSRQRLPNPIERPETGAQGDNRPVPPVQNILKKVKKNLARRPKLA